MVSSNDKECLGNISVSGFCRYRDYTDNMLEECEPRIRSGDLTHQNASNEYKLPRTAIKTNLLANILNQLVDHQSSVLNEERLILHCVQLM